MESSEVLAAFADVFDEALVFHGFADHVRDYDAYVYVHGSRASTLRFRFRHCVSASVETALPSDIWGRSLDDRLLDGDAEPDGFVWGVRWQVLYPGFELVAESARARQWSADLQIPFFEATIGTNAQVVTLVFADLVVETMPPGHAPFVVEA